MSGPDPDAVQLPVLIDDRCFVVYLAGYAGWNHRQLADSPAIEDIDEAVATASPLGFVA
jgi:hypothetical protein